MKTKPDINSLIDSYGNTISRISNRMIDNNELAKEAAQEVWFEIVKSIDSFKGNSSISTWIYVIARRTILKYSHKEKFIKKNELAAFFEMDEIEYSGSNDNKSDWVKQQCNSCLTGYFHCLNNDARLILLFRLMANLSYSQIATIMDLETDNVKKICSRSKLKISNYMNGYCSLFNPNERCKCRIKKHVEDVNFDKEFHKLEQLANLANFFKKFDQTIPLKNYWEKFLS